MTCIIRKFVKLVLKLIVLTSFVILIGSVGAHDAGNISLLRMFAQVALSALAIIVFAKIEDNI